MRISDWKDFRDSLVIVWDDDEPLPLPTNESLDSFERKSGIRLPRSYREFLLVFGPGRFQASLEIAAPDYPTAASQYDLMRAHLGYSPVVKDLCNPADPISVRLFYFGLINERDWLGWDFEDVRHPQGNEYAIYQIGDDYKLLATTFKELIEKVCGELFAPSPTWKEENCGPQRSFYPATKYVRRTGPCAEGWQGSGW